MSADIPDRHSAGVHVKDPIVQASELRLALFDQLRLEAGVAVAWRVHRDGPELGPDGLAGRPVAMVASPARRCLPRRIAQMVGQLALQRGVDHPPRELGEQAARAGDLRRVKPFERVLQRLCGQQASQAVLHPLRQLIRLHLGLPEAATLRGGLLGHVLHDEWGPLPAAPDPGSPLAPGAPVEPGSAHKPIS
jgi:hypothetical protein